jgi:hypothetical protein
MLTLKQLENFNLNELSDVYLALGTAANRAVPNPFFGVFPSNTSLGASPTISQKLAASGPRVGMTEIPWIEASGDEMPA